MDFISIGKIRQVLSGAKNPFDDSIPNNDATLEIFDDGVKKYVAFGNDASEILFGYSDRWTNGYSRKVFHRIIVWYLARWACEWFGLRRWFWLKLLRIEMKKLSPFHRKLAQGQRVPAKSHNLWSGVATKV